MTEARKKPVELKAEPRPSRIRRDPVRADDHKMVVGKIDFNSREWEITAGIIGMVLFALALNVVWIGFSAWMAK